MKRHYGYVMGSVSSSGRKTVWKVRVKDSTSPYDRQRLIAASVRGGLELARGLNVHFAIGTVDDQEGRKALRAVDVTLDTDLSQE